MLNLKGLIGQGAMPGQGVNKQQSKNKPKNNKLNAFGSKTSPKAERSVLNFVSMHERNGTRGNGIGMGHRNVQKRAK